jgi:hypothetical protein
MLSSLLDTSIIVQRKLAISYIVYVFQLICIWKVHGLYLSDDYPNIFLYFLCEYQCYFLEQI